MFVRMTALKYSKRTIGYRGGDVKSANRSSGGKTRNIPEENVVSGINQRAEHLDPIYLS